MKYLINYVNDLYKYEWYDMKKFLLISLFSSAVAGAYYLQDREDEQSFKNNNSSIERDIDIPFQRLRPESKNILEISSIQEKFLELGIPLGQCGANGLYKGEMIKAVKHFQKSVNLKADGIIGQETYNHLNHSIQQRRELRTYNDKSPIIKFNTLRRSRLNYGWQDRLKIRDIQIALIQNGSDLSPCWANGEFNKTVESAVISFQKDNKIFPITGEVDDETFDAIIESAKIANAKRGIERFLSPHTKADKLPNNISEIAKDYFPKHNVSKWMLDKIKDGAQKAKFDFIYLVNLAAVESSFKPWATPGEGLTAKGTFQFIEQTWLSMLKKHGAKYGLEQEASRIKLSGKRYNVPDKSAREYILNDLRTNPEISAIMASEFAKDNLRSLQKADLKMTIGYTELYTAHFFGARDAARFLKAYQKDPSQSAAELFPNAAKANTRVFYINGNKSKPRNLMNVYSYFSNKMSIANQHDKNRVLAMKSNHKL